MRFRQVLGLVLVVAACLGVFTVADDLDHVGELFCVGGVLVAGVAFLLPWTGLRSRRG